jgi:phosphopantothenoylcysteine decarboxylase/phosphopantothenate--cysteine ligase
MNDSVHITLGVTGGIAAYKAADLTSKLTSAGVTVHVVMTESATKLVTPRTFQTLSRQAVTTSLWDVCDWKPEHVELGVLSKLLVTVGFGVPIGTMKKARAIRKREWLTIRLAQSKFLV